MRLLKENIAIAVLLVLAAAGMELFPAAARQFGGPQALDTASSITYFIADGGSRNGYRASDRELALWALQAWQRSAPGILRFAVAAEPNAIVRLYWTEANEGGYGEMRPLVVDGHPGATVYIQPDVASLDGEIAHRAQNDPLWRESIVYLTCLHELGHALGLEHTRDFRDIMYFFGYGGDIVAYFNRYRAQIHSRADIANVSGLSDGDVQRLRKLYGAK
jgi:hypothetical protein